MVCLVERAVQTFKEGVKDLEEGSLETHMARFLSKYKLTPHSTTGLSPCEMLLGRHPRSYLDLMNPNLEERVRSNQMKQKARHDHSISVCNFIGDAVNVRSFNNVNHWIPGRIVVVTGPLLYKIQMSDYSIIRRVLITLRFVTQKTEVCYQSHLAEFTSKITSSRYHSLTNYSSHSSKET